MKTSRGVRTAALTLAAGVGMSLIALAAFTPNSSRPSESAAVAAPNVAQDMTQAGINFLARLPEDQKAKATFAFDDAKRSDWHFIPKTRKGLKLSELGPEQRHAAHALIASGLSSRGYVKAVTIMSLEQILFELEGPKARFKRDPELYHFCIFGKPAPGSTWGLSIEGHHLSLNFTIIKGQYVAAKPAFFGTNPDIVMEGKRKGTRALPIEEDLGRKLVKSLKSDQKKTAIFSEKSPSDILSKAKPFVKRDDVGGGLAYADMTDDQKKMVRDLVTEYAVTHRTEIAQQELAKIAKSGWAKVTFAWAGGLEPGQGHYYRVKGETFLIEYANVQNKANHCHAVWRDYDNDFGVDLLRAHYKKEHSK